MAKAKRKGSVTLRGRTINFETTMSSGGHVDYSGFGVHSDKRKRNDRRNRKLEEKRARFGDWD